MSDPSRNPDQPAYFDAMFAASDDPWKFRSRWYEKRKRALTLASLPAERYASGFEPGCANGELSAELATRCDRLLATDGVAQAVVLARERLLEFGNVCVRQAWLPEEWPDEKFDLIVLSEFLFYLKASRVAEIAACCLASLNAGGAILACHWRHPIEHCEMSGDTVHSMLDELIPFRSHCHIVEPDLRLDVWSAAPTVAEREQLL